MTAVIDGITVLTYEEWFKLPDVKKLYEELEDNECGYCYGSGEHTCDCGDTHDCHECGGSGCENPSRDIRGMYEAALRNELEKLLQWREGRALRASALDPQ